MKKTTSLVDALKLISPITEIPGLLSSPDKILKHYFSEVDVKNEWSACIKSLDSNINNWTNSWSKISLMIGLLYRIQNDGHGILEMIGLSPEESRQFVTICAEIRARSSSYREYCGSSQTKILYDQIRQIGF